MNCLDYLPNETTAVAICGHCGAALCPTHLTESDEHLTVRRPIAMREAVTPPARKLRCPRCAAAEAAQRTARSSAS
jgi:hypothetical protein